MHHLNGILGTKAMQEQANLGYSNIWRESNQLLHMVTGMEEKLQKQWRENLRDHGCFITYNHPVWSRVEPHEFEIDGIYNSLEIYNTIR